MVLSFLIRQEGEIMKIRTKLLLIGILISLFLVCIVMATVFIQNKKVLLIGEQESLKLAYADLNHIVESLYTLADSHQEVIQKEIIAALNVAENLIQTQGGISLSQEEENWTAVNQFTKESQKIHLPKMNLGYQWLGKISSPQKKVPLVDEVENLVDSTCTIFQRMNNDGDMLRVATNIIKKNGNRAVGTFIPAINPDGKPNPVISTVLQGKTFKGRAFVVNAWYITAYKPIFDEKKHIIGVLYTGIAQENVKNLRKAIMDMKIGDSGYVTVLDSAGNVVISKEGKHDGKSFMDQRDNSGNPYIKKIIAAAKKLSPGQIGDTSFSIKGTDNEPIIMDGKFIYFKPWDWIIIAQGAKCEFTKVSDMIEDMGNKSNYIIGGIGIAMLLVTAIIWYFVAANIVKPINMAAESLQDIAQGDGDLTTRLKINTHDEIGILATNFNAFIQKLHGMIANISKGVETLASSASQLTSTASSLSDSADQTSEKAGSVAAASEEMSSNMNGIASAMEESNANMTTVAGAAGKMHTTINEIAQNAEEARNITGEAVGKSGLSAKHMGQLSESANDIGKVVETITEISEQVNLLSLNATIEAARAGEAGKGFAVVANEIKELARQTAEASLDIKKKIDSIQESSENSLQSMEEISSVITKVNEIVSTIAAAVEEQSSATSDIASNIDQASSGVEEVNSNVNESSAVTAEITRDIALVNESSSDISKQSHQINMSAKELSEFARELDNMVRQFKV